MANDTPPPHGQTWEQDELSFSPAVDVHPPAFPMTGGDRFRRLQDDLETRRERIAFEDRYRGPLEEESWNPKPAERTKTIAPAPSRQWVVTVFAGLYAEAARNGLKGFYRSWCAPLCRFGGRRIAGCRDLAGFPLLPRRSIASGGWMGARSSAQGVTVTDGHVTYLHALGVARRLARALSAHVVLPAAMATVPPMAASGRAQRTAD